MKLLKKHRISLIIELAMDKESRRGRCSSRHGGSRECRQNKIDGMDLYCNLQIFSGGPLSKRAGDALVNKGVPLFTMYGR